VPAKKLIAALVLALAGAGTGAGGCLALDAMHGDPGRGDGVSRTPHLDAVEAALRELSPGSEGRIWERSEGNRISEAGPEASDWLLQSPDCWGRAHCDGVAGAGVLADALFRDIAAATEWIDIATLVVFPDGVFQEAIVRGIKEALRRNPDVTIRILAGTPPGLGHFSTSITESAKNYRDHLARDLGRDADTARIIVAGVQTSWLYSWNHAKIVAVDGRTAIVGGHNWWQASYASLVDPVNDVSMRLSGPAARSAHKFADELWDFACTRGTGLVNGALYVDLEPIGRMGDHCPRTHRVAPVEQAGAVPVLALGGLGIGMDVPGGTGGGLPAASDSRAACSRWFTDYVNDDGPFTVANPDLHGLRALIASATREIVLSQQDLIAPCVPPAANSYYDARLLDLLADKLIDGVPTRIVLSEPGARQGYLNPYSNMKRLTDVTDILLRKVRARAGVDGEGAWNIVCRNLQLAPIRNASGVETWPNGNGIANHAKVVLVDGAAFYVGARNLYPAAVQDFGFVVEDPAAAAALERDYTDRLWEQSRAAAVVDFETGRCDL
jgi:phosphatidylserine/phosphatidylglycerophosphate/cardiolipin synthase-like enzyme